MITKDKLNELCDAQAKLCSFVRLMNANIVL